MYNRENVTSIWWTSSAFHKLRVVLFLNAVEIFTINCLKFPPNLFTKSYCFIFEWIILEHKVAVFGTGSIRTAHCRVVTWRYWSAARSHWPGPLQDRGRRWRQFPVCCQRQRTRGGAGAVDEGGRTGTAWACRGARWPTHNAWCRQHRRRTLHLPRHHWARSQPSRGRTDRLW